MLEFELFAACYSRTRCTYATPAQAYFCVSKLLLVLYVNVNYSAPEDHSGLGTCAEQAAYQALKGEWGFAGQHGYKPIHQ